PSQNRELALTVTWHDLSLRKPWSWPVPWPSKTHGVRDVAKRRALNCRGPYSFLVTSTSSLPARPPGWRSSARRRRPEGAGSERRALGSRSFPGRRLGRSRFPAAMHGAGCEVGGTQTERVVGLGSRRRQQRGSRLELRPADDGP